MSLAIAAALLFAQAPAVEWEKVNEGSDAIVFVDPTSLRRTGDSVRMRQRTEFSEVDEYGMRSLVFDATVDCAARTYTMHRIEGYRPDGSLIRAHDIAPGTPGSEIPLAADDPSAQALHRRSCEGTAR